MSEQQVMFEGKWYTIGELKQYVTEHSEKFKYHHSKETKQKISNAIKLKYKNNPDIVKRMTESLKQKYKNGWIGPRKGKKHSGETRRKMRKNHWTKNPKYAELAKVLGTNFGKSMKGVIHSDEWNKKVSEALKGKKKSKEHIEKMRKSLLEGYSSGRIKHGHPSPETMKTIWSNPEYKKRLSASHKLRWLKPEFKEKMKAMRKQRWSNMDFRNYMLKKMAEGRKKRPTSVEICLIRFLEKHKLPFKYCGDGSIWFGGTNPDFIRNDLKARQIIEVWGDYWHRLDNVERVKNHYQRYGNFEVLVIWEREFYIENWEEVMLKKIKDFMSSKNIPEVKCVA